MSKYRHAVLSLKPVAYWRLGEAPGATTAVDETGNGHDGTYNGPTLGVESGLVDTDTAVELDGVDDYIDFGDKTEFEFEVGESFALGFWIHPTDLANNSTPLTKGHGHAPSNDYPWYLFRYRDDSVSNSIDFYLRTSDNVDHSVNAGVNLLDAWHYVMGVYDVNFASMYLYVDGVLRGSASGVTEDAYGTNSASLESGFHATGYFPGIVDEIVIYNKSITSQDIKYLYNLGRGKASASYRDSVLSLSPVGYWRFNDEIGSTIFAAEVGSDGSVGSDKTFVKDSPLVIPSNSIVNKDDTTSESEVIYYNGLSNLHQRFAIAMWYKPIEPHSAYAVHPLRKMNATDDATFSIYQFGEGGSSPGSNRINLYMTQAGSWTSVLSYIFPEFNRWYFFVFCYDSVDSSLGGLWVDGIKENWQSGTGESAQNTSNLLFRLRISQQSEVAIWDRCLSDSEIKELYNSAFVTGRLFDNNNLHIANKLREDQPAYDYLNELTFTRNSIAYLDGKEYTIDEPRISEDGVLIEEGTENLLNSDVALSNDPAAYSGSNQSGEFILDYPSIGGGYIRWTKPSSGGSNIYQPSISLTAGQTYVFSFWLRNIDSDNIRAGFNGGTNEFVVFSVSDKWERYQVVFTPDVDGTWSIGFWQGNQTEGTSFELNGWQLEAKSYPTTWHIVESSRLADHLYTPISIENQGTLEFDFYVNDAFRNPPEGNRNAIGGIGNSSAPSNRLQLGLRNNQISLLNRDDNNSNSYIYGPDKSNVEDGVHRISVTWDSNDYHRLYLDGEFIGDNTFTKPTISHLIVGGWNTSWAARPNAPISSVKLSSHNLSDSEIAESVKYTLKEDVNTIYIANFSKYEDMNITNLGELVVPEDFSEVPDSVEFDGVDDHIIIDTGSNTTNALTISTWIFPESMASDRMFLGPLGSVSSAYYCRLRSDDSLHMSVSTQESGQQAISGSVLNMLQWYFVVFEYNGTKLKIFVDGILDVEKDLGGETLSAWGYGGIGIWRDNDPRYYAGKIKDMRIHNRALHEEEIKNLHNGKKINTKGLICYWPLDDGGGDIARDRSGNDNHGTLENGASWAYSRDADTNMWTTNGKLNIRGELVEG